MPALTRRGFLKTSAAGMALSVVPLSVLLPATGAAAAEMAPPAGWKGPPGKARYRIDGLTKVTGGKIYARDFRPRDLPGWPGSEEVVLVLRTPFADRRWLGLELDLLPAALRPLRVTTAADLTRDRVATGRTARPLADYLATPGETPDYLGQAVALLHFPDLRTMARARSRLRQMDHRGLRAGPPMPPQADGYYRPDSSIVHAQKNGRQIFAQVDGGPVHPQDMATPRDREAMALVDGIRARLDDPDAYGLSALRQSYSTQVIDPMFMEPESGLAWYDRSDNSLHLLIGTQSPGEDVEGAGDLFSDPACAIGVRRVEMFAAYPGGGFGGRDTSPLCLMLALAAVYAERPVRIVHDRFEQFQSGIKRHAAQMDLTLAVDREGRFQAMRNYITLNGGGRKNVSQYVAEVAGLNGTGPYALPLADIWSRATRTRSPIGGSMRGFGGVQSQFAMESMVDEAAAAAGIDPIELRRRNVLAAGAPVATGAPHAPPGLAEMCRQAAAHPLWQERDARRAAAADSDAAYGVGFALAMKNYGSGADAVLTEVSLEPDGRIVVDTHAIDMGSGTATTLALATAEALGANADAVNTGLVGRFDALQLVDGFDAQPDNPRWTPITYSSTKASGTAGIWVHGVEQASLILLLGGLLPAAGELWGLDEPPGLIDVEWRDGALTAAGQTAIPLAALARHAHDRGHVVAAMVHAFFSGDWVSADFEIDGITRHWPVDALAIRRGGSADRELIDRTNLRPVTVESLWEGNGQRFGAAACLLAVTADRRSGRVTLREGVQYLGPGRILQPDLMEGQMDGAFAMGVGQALLEDLPPFEAGAGNGTWNLNRYHVPLSGDVALERVAKVILPPEGPDSPARGMAEVAMMAVAPAIANAVAHATGVRVRDLPITPERLLAGWRMK